MISLKVISEYCSICGAFRLSSVDLLPVRSPEIYLLVGSVALYSIMADKLQYALGSLSLGDDEPIDLPDSPRFKVFEENARSLLGRLLNPSCQPMDEMIETMPRVWRVYDRVRGIALSSEKFQFVFQREEYLETVLRDRPWSFKQWTMLLDRWIPSPPRNFLTTVDVWVRISKIPMNYYKIETMDFLASKVGRVLEIAYDPKVSQKETYIRAHVRLDIASPAFASKSLNLPSGGSVVIEFEYEKLRKRCFHCFRLTHERPLCPLLNRRAVVQTKSGTMVQAGERVAGSNAQVDDGVISAGPAVPPGFPPLFPQLSPETKKAALQYISHSDETERRARIARVEMSILEGDADHTPARPIISQDLNNWKGHVFGFTDTLKGSQELVDTCAEASESSALEATSSFSPVGSTVFRIGSSSDVHLSGTQSEGKKSRRRPNKWKRLALARAMTKVSDQSILAVVEPEANLELQRHEFGLEGSSKRKAVSNVGDHSSKSPKTFLDTVASDLKPLPSQ
ncbi:hypothetical protein Bca52824_025899 [Brassica carinata]|uniref:DUF4283 domain-containing protein n=1 Tax=Brassica carinata TaxID=52824 RepID=A0A8X7V9P3_BRACI|nr:hypothetical protein Bca52824_025899 [Brassica carinata]